MRHADQVDPVLMYAPPRARNQMREELLPREGTSSSVSVANPIPAMISR
jgi:hypothetical protein